MPDDRILLQRLADESAIRDVIARFGDTGMRADYEGFRAVWAPDAVWEMPEPVSLRGQGIDAIVAMLHKQRDDKDFFAHFALPGPIMIEGDEATTRCVLNEAASGTNGVYFRNYNICSDWLRRSDDGWVFTKRSVRFLWLDTSPFGGQAFKIE